MDPPSRLTLLVVPSDLRITLIVRHTILGRGITLISHRATRDNRRSPHLQSDRKPMLENVLTRFIQTTNTKFQQLDARFQSI